MFMERIFVRNIGDIRYGYTEIPASRTMAEIMNLLKEYECEEILTRASRTGNDQIAFIFQGTPFLITIPKVYVGKNKVYNERIGIRMVLYYLEVILAWAKIRAIDINNLLMGQRIVQIGDKTMTMSEVVNTLPPVELGKIFVAGKQPQLNKAEESEQ